MIIGTSKSDRAYTAAIKFPINKAPRVLPIVGVDMLKTSFFPEPNDEEERDRINRTVLETPKRSADVDSILIKTYDKARRS